MKTPQIESKSYVRLTHKLGLFGFRILDFLGRFAFFFNSSFFGISFIEAI